MAVVPESVGKIETLGHEITAVYMIADIALWSLIWGEAGNIRFLPEALSFIYHNLVREIKYVFGHY